MQETSHYRYRHWCRRCVAGCGRRDAHKTIEGDTIDETIETIAMDHAFFYDDVDKVTIDSRSLILVTPDKPTGALFADVL